MSKEMVAVRMPNVHDAENLLLTEKPIKYKSTDGRYGSQYLVVSMDSHSLGLFDTDKREVISDLPVSHKKGEMPRFDVRLITEVTEDVMANPIINPAQEEQVTSLVFMREGCAPMTSHRISGTDGFISAEAVATVTPNSMSYDDSNIGNIIKEYTEFVKDSVIVSRSHGEVCNYVRPKAVYSFEPGKEVVFGEVERTPENDSYPNIVKDELKPPELGAVYRVIEPVPEKEFLARFNERKAAWEERMAERAAAREQNEDIEEEEAVGLER